MTTKQALNWTMEKIRSTPNRRFMKSHANLKELPVGKAKGLKVGAVYTFSLAADSVWFVVVPTSNQNASVLVVLRGEFAKIERGIRLWIVWSVLRITQLLTNFASKILASFQISSSAKDGMVPRNYR